MNKNIKAVIIILVILAIAFVIYKFAFKKMVKGYAKKPGDWVACGVKEYDKDYYKGSNTAGVEIFFKKGDVKLRPGKDKSLGQCADATSNMNVYTLKK